MRYLVEMNPCLSMSYVITWFGPKKKNECWSFSLCTLILSKWFEFSHVQIVLLFEIPIVFTLILPKVEVSWAKFHRMLSCRDWVFEKPLQMMDGSRVVLVNGVCLCLFFKLIWHIILYVSYICFYDFVCIQFNILILNIYDTLMILTRMMGDPRISYSGRGSSRPCAEGFSIPHGGRCTYQCDVGFWQRC